LYPDVIKTNIEISAPLSNIISMSSGESIHNFTQITVNSEGVRSFISKFQPVDIAPFKVFFIESLNLKNIPRFEENLFPFAIQGDITLQNVVIIKHPENNKEITREVACKYNGAYYYGAVKAKLLSCRGGHTAREEDWNQFQLEEISCKKEILRMIISFLTSKITPDIYPNVDHMLIELTQIQMSAAQEVLRKLRHLFEEQSSDLPKLGELSKRVAKADFQEESFRQEK